MQKRDIDQVNAVLLQKAAIDGICVLLIVGGARVRIFRVLPILPHKRHKQRHAHLIWDDKSAVVRLNVGHAAVGLVKQSAYADLLGISLCRR